MKGFECVKSPDLVPPSDWLGFMANPAVRIPPYKAWKLQLETIDTTDFHVSVIVTFGGTNSSPETTTEYSSTDEDIEVVELSA